MDNTAKHICGICNDEWLTEQEYLEHICPTTQAQPTDPQHLINSTTPDFAAISEAAVARGADSVPTTEPTISEPDNPIPSDPEVAPAPAQPTPETVPEVATPPVISLN